MSDQWPYRSDPQPPGTNPSSRTVLISAVVLAGGYLLGRATGFFGGGVRIFVSYDYEHDRHYRQLLSAWSSNPRFSFAFEDHSTPRVNSDQAARIKGAIAAKLSGAECLLVIVGEHTHRSQWVSWEIQKAKELGLSLVAVKVKRSYKTPAALLGSKASWAYGFSEEAVAKAVAATRSRRIG